MTTGPVTCRSRVRHCGALTRAGGNRVHLDNFDRVLSFGGRWRREATAGLRALALDPPEDS
jgi:hypothetical protein